VSRRLLAGALALGLTACTTTLDVDRARRWIDARTKPPLPKLGEATIAALPAPEGLRATSGELRAIPLRWEPLLRGDVGGYAVERAEERDGDFERIAAVAGNATTLYVDRGPNRWPRSVGAEVSTGTDYTRLGDGETRFYRVRAFTPEGELARTVSDVIPGSTAATPDPPTLLRAYSHQPRRVPLSWAPTDDPLVDGYAVERGPTSRGPFEPLARVEGRQTTQHVDRGLGDLRVVYYRVASINGAGGRGEFSEPVRGVTKADPLPPIGLRVVARQLGVNQLAWEPNVEPDLSGYRLLRIRGSREASEVVALLDGGVTTARDSEVSANERVSYTVVALDRDGLESAAPEPITVESVGYQLRATPGDDGVHLEWNPRREEGFRSARIYLHRALRRSELAHVTGSRYVHTEVKPGRRYRYTVVLEKDEANPGPPSSPVEVTVPKR
jgi:fibronectin type 3 domain-containing protein